MPSQEYQRWYDRDPALSQALATLRDAPDKYQAQIALNIIVVIVEHQIEHETLGHVDDLVTLLGQAKETHNGNYRRWYDVNETLRSAMKLLQDCPEDVQKQIIPSICRMVEDSLDGKLLRDETE